MFEGNGGDLRIGLAMQSLHDGRELRHQPLRLSVFVEAPRAPLDAVVSDHAVVQDLVLNGWVHLLRIDPDTGEVELGPPGLVGVGLHGSDDGDRRCRAGDVARPLPHRGQLDQGVAAR